jgi:hypothetical protein
VIHTLYYLGERLGQWRTCIPMFTILLLGMVFFCMAGKCHSAEEVGNKEHKTMDGCQSAVIVMQLVLRSLTDVQPYLMNQSIILQNTVFELLMQNCL